MHTHTHTHTHTATPACPPTAMATGDTAAMAEKRKQLFRTRQKSKTMYASRSLTKLSSDNHNSRTNGSLFATRGRSRSNLSLGHAPSMTSVIEEPRRSTSISSKHQALFLYYAEHNEYKPRLSLYNVANSCIVVRWATVLLDNSMVASVFAYKMHTRNWKNSKPMLCLSSSSLHGTFSWGEIARSGRRILHTLTSGRTTVSNRRHQLFC